MKGYVQNIESIAVKNEEFRRVVYTAKNCQLVVMALSTIPVPMRRRTMNTSTVKQRNKDLTGRWSDCLRGEKSNYIRERTIMKADQECTMDVN